MQLGSPSELELHDRYLDGEAAPVASHSHHLEGVLQQVRELLVDGAAEALQIARALLGRHEQVGDVAPEGLLGRPAEQLGGGRVPDGDAPVGAAGEDGIARQLDGLAEQHLALVPGVVGRVAS